MCIFYAALDYHLHAFSLIVEMVVLLLLFCLYASLGHIVNSYSDRVIDHLAGKPNILAQLPDKIARELVFLVIMADLLITFLFYYDESAVLVLFYLAITIAALYSLPPIRLKERGILGLVAAAIAQRTLPVVIIFQALDAWGLSALLLCVLATLIGMRYIIIHQIKDEKADLRTQVQTVATTKGVFFLQRLLRQIIFPLELVTLIITLFVISTDFYLLGVLVVIYALWSGLQLLVLDTNKETRFSIESYTILADLYYLYWPLLFSALLIERDSLFWLVLGFTVIWLLRRLRREVVQVWQVIIVFREKINFSN